VSFFEPPPWRSPGDGVLWPPPWLRPPEAVLPGIVPVELLLARTDTHAVLAVDLLAYPTGLDFALVTRRHPGQPRERHRRGQLRGDGLFGDRGLRFEIWFADGQVMSNHPRYRPGNLEGEAPDQPVLYEVVGSGEQDGWRLQQWLWGLPPPGPLVFVCEWPACQIPESRVEIDAALVLEAASRAVPV
jgi:hypothetical protein